MCHLILEKLIFRIKSTYSVVEIVNVLFEGYIRMHVSFFIAKFTTCSTISRIETGIAPENSTAVIAIVVQGTKIDIVA